MPVRPVLMVLYTNDAVEVRYTDGSRMHVLPCGSSFSFHTSQEAHPVHGMKTVQQRCCYATSAYRDMVLSALDFRNRFAERPYLCQELMEPDQVVSLYARIKNVAWPKTASCEKCEVLEDGSIRIISEDEFGSLILSAHRKDFTVCYLSLLSQEKLRDRTKVRKTKQSSSSNNSRSRENQYNSKQNTEYNPNLSDESAKSNTSDELLYFNKHAHKSRNGNRNSNDSMDKQIQDDDLNISPITQASCTDSPQALSNASGSPLTPQNAVKDNEAKFRPFSTPTEGLEDELPVCTPYGKTAVFRDYHGDQQQSAGFTDHLATDSQNRNDKHNVQKQSSGKVFNDRTSIRDEINNNKYQYHERGSHYTEKIEGKSTRATYETKHSVKLNADLESQNTTSLSRGSNDSGASSRSDDSKSETRCQYCWVTRHISCDECPVSWNHVVKMATEVAENGCQNRKQVTEPGKSKSKGKLDGLTHLRKLKRETCVFSSLPLPLPLSCPGQHLHKSQLKSAYDDGKNPLEDPTTFSLGRLKILLIDGVIYRIVRLSSIKVVEVYPGDGSVLMSQGMAAHFFQHVIPVGGKLEERTYSIKSPPSTSCGAYSVKSLINRASRFLAHVRHEDNMATVGLCCWKHEEITLVEPMSTSILEECTIPGYGKFTAMSNGQVRIVFQDRTCLDMTCDFTPRIQNCMHHSADGDGMQMMLADKKAGTCRLLLPNGQYQMVDVKQPGKYNRYIDIAREWTDWVNSSPSKRQNFYKDKNEKNMSVERELQKIQCFNYIVDNAVLKTTHSDSLVSDHSVPGAFKPYSASNDKARPSILRNSDQNKRHKGSEQFHPSSHRSVQIHSPPSESSKHHSSQSTVPNYNHLGGANAISQNFNSSYSSLPSSVRLNPIGQTSSHSMVQPIKSNLSSLDGFNAVREALMRTSSVINDIDHILEKR